MAFAVNEDQLSREIRDLERLPALSATASRLLSVISDPDLEISELAEIIEQDPPLTARIIGLSNAAFFAQARPVHKVEEAIVRVLGLNMVRSLSLSIALAGTFNPYACAGFDIRNYWSTSMISAVLGKSIAQSVSGTDVPSPDVLYLCGLLHGIGELVLVHLHPDEMSQIYRQLTGDPDQQIEQLERDTLGMDQWQAGQWLSRRWHLPEVVAHTMGYLQEADYDGPDACAVEIVRAARSWALSQLQEQPEPLSVAGLEHADLENIEGALLSRMDDVLALAGSMT